MLALKTAEVRCMAQSAYLVTAEVSQVCGLIVAWSPAYLVGLCCLYLNMRNGTA